MGAGLAVRGARALDRGGGPAPAARADADRAPDSGPVSGTWFTLHANQIAASGRTGNMELEILHPPGAAESALSRWFREGERVFQACRARGHGGEGFQPPVRAGLRP